MNYYIYILTSQPNGTLYIGRTENLLRRMEQHRQEVVDGFTKQHHVHRLVYFEVTDSAEAAAYRERQLKNWHRDWKKNLIERDNPHWEDLFLTLIRAETGEIKTNPHAELVSASTLQQTHPAGRTVGPETSSGREEKRI
ncbi:MAG: GIY-YIG nuclease family protein [Rickettsiales bacterium]|nr:GIY-YIG nuclease family protein [Rickettsiales bacterium]